MNVLKTKMSLTVILLNVLHHIVALGWRNHCADGEYCSALFWRSLVVEDALCVHQNDRHFVAVIEIVCEDVWPHPNAGGFTIGSASRLESIPRRSFFVLTNPIRNVMTFVLLTKTMRMFWIPKILAAENGGVIHFALPGRTDISKRSWVKNFFPYEMHRQLQRSLLDDFLNRHVQKSVPTFLGGIWTSDFRVL